MDDHNRRSTEWSVFRGPVRPTDAEAELPVYRRKQPWGVYRKTQLEAGTAGFEQNQILLLRGNQPAESLNEVIQ